MVNLALITTMTQIQKERQRVHDPVECSVSVFSQGGKRYLQLDTYGRSERELPGKTSQALQFDRQGAERLLQHILETFPDLRK